MLAARVTSRRLSAPKLRSASSVSAALMMARRVASLRSSREGRSGRGGRAGRSARGGRGGRVRDEREFGVRLFTDVKRNTIGVNPLTIRERVFTVYICSLKL